MKTLHLNDIKSLPEGKYWIGDPCYVYPDSKWSEFVRMLFAEDDTGRGKQGIFETDGVRWAMFSTAYGDGCYNVKKSRRILGNVGVDSGSIACIPQELVKKWGNDEGWDLGVLQDLPAGEVFYTNGTLTFSSIYINTGVTSKE